MQQKTILAIFTIAAILGFFLFNTDINERVELLIQKSELGSKENPIKRAEHELRMLVNPATGKIPKNIRRKELEFIKSIPTNKEYILSKGLNIETINFQSRGPVNRGGRVRALGIDVRSTSASNSVIIAAGVSGGIWRSINNGASWVQTSLPSQINSASCIAQDVRPGHQDTWYIGTGEAYGNSARGGSANYLGDGIFKSTDNGLSWNQLPSTVSNTPNSFDQAFDFVNSIAVNPVTGTLFAGAINTIVKSTDGGSSWTTVRSTPQNATFTDVIATKSGTIFATVNSFVPDKGIWKSTDDGVSWTDITPSEFPSTYVRVVIAVAPSDENRIYLLAHTPGFGKDGNSFWASSNGGTSWSNYSNNIPDTEGSVGGYNAQGSYNMVIAVKPDDPNFVLFGGTNLHRSTNGMTSKLNNTYSNWIGGYSVANDISEYPNHHPDLHALVFAPYNSSILYSGDDGGVHITNNISRSFVVWRDINNGFITSQFYSIAIDHATSGNPVLLGGLQDNGHYFVNSTDGTAHWVAMIGGGDGTFTAIANGRKYYYIATQNGNLIRLQLNNAGNYTTWTVAKPDHSTNYLFINPYTLDPNNSNIMYFVAGDSLWRNSNLTAIPNWSNEPTNVNWSVLSNTRTGNIITAVSASKAPANIVYYGTSDGRIYRLNNANAGNPTPTDIWSGKGLPKGYVSSLAIDPNNGDNVLVSFSNYEIISLYYTSNGGTTWSAVAGNLEENSRGTGAGPSCRWASITNYGGSTTYFVATSAGLYSTNTLNGMSTNWKHESPNKIGVSVCTMVKTREVDGKVVVATHGSGVYSGTVVTNIEGGTHVPINFELSQNYPNPFNPSTTINYSITKSGLVSLKVYNIRGELVTELVNNEQTVGNYSVIFDASNLASGTYIYELQSNENKIAKKMLLIK